MEYKIQSSEGRKSLEEFRQLGGGDQGFRWEGVSRRKPSVRERGILKPLRDQVQGGVTRVLGGERGVGGGRVDERMAGKYQENRAILKALITFGKGN